MRDPYETLQQKSGYLIKKKKRKEQQSVLASEFHSDLFSEDLQTKVTLQIDQKQ
jgi:hypothetical protein